MASETTVGPCLVLDAPFTREELLGRGVQPEAADELLAFAGRLAAKARMRADGLTPVDQEYLGRREGDCFAACVATLVARPLAEVRDAIGHGDGEQDEEHWFDRLVRVLGGWRWTAVHEGSMTPAGYAIAIGQSPRGTLHSCVTFAGAIVHDPHPSRAGVLRADSYITLAASTE